jgi:hypothetical protein
MLLRHLLFFGIFVAACDSPAGMNNFRRDGMLTFEDEDLSVPGEPPDLRVSTTGDMAQDVEDLSLLPEDLMAAARGDMAGAGGCNIKVNELLLSTLRGAQSRGSEEYVELYNPCATSKSLKGWSIRYRSIDNNSKASNPDTPLVQDVGRTIAAGGYLLFAGTQYGGSKDGSLINGLSDSGGGVAIIDNNNVIVDSVAYGNVVSSHSFLEGTHAPLPSQTMQPGTVTARSPNGTDTDDNGADFKVQAPTPKAANL